MATVLQNLRCRVEESYKLGRKVAATPTARSPSKTPSARASIRTTPIRTSS